MSCPNTNATLETGVTGGFLQRSCCGFAGRGMRAAAVCELKALRRGSSHTPVWWFSLRASGSGPVKANSKKSGEKTPRSQQGANISKRRFMRSPPVLAQERGCGTGGAGAVGGDRRLRQHLRMRTGRRGCPRQKDPTGEHVPQLQQRARVPS